MDPIAQVTWRRLARSNWNSSLTASARSVCIRGDLIPQLPKFPVGYMLHALLQNFHRCSHRPNHTGADDALRQLEMVEAESLQTLIKVKHALRHLVQAKKLFVPAIDIIQSQALARELLLKRIADSWRDMQQGKKSGRVQAAPVPQAGPNDVIIIRRDGFQNMEQGDGVLQHGIGPAHEPGRVGIVSLGERYAGSLQLPTGALHQ